VSQRGLLLGAGLMLAATAIAGAPAWAADTVKSEPMGGGYRLSYPIADGSDPVVVRKQFLAKADELCRGQYTIFGAEVVVRNTENWDHQPLLFTVPVTCSATPPAPPTPPGPPPPRRQN
jgi:hypothetical protein